MHARQPKGRTERGAVPAKAWKREDILEISICSAPTVSQVSTVLMAARESETGASLLVAPGTSVPLAQEAPSRPSAAIPSLPASSTPTKPWFHCRSAGPPGALARLELWASWREGPPGPPGPPWPSWTPVSAGPPYARISQHGMSGSGHSRSIWRWG